MLTRGTRPGPPTARGSGSHDRAPLVPSGKPPGSPFRKNPGAPPSRRSGPTINRPTGPPGGRAPLVPGGHSPGPLPGRGASLPRGASGNGGGRDPGRTSGGRGSMPSPEESVKALIEINQCIRESDRTAALMTAEPTPENVRNVQKLLVLIRRMIALMTEFGPQREEEDDLASEMSALAVAPDGRRVDAEERRMEKQFREDMLKTQQTVDMYERALECAKTNRPEGFRKIMAPIVRAVQEGE